MNKITFEIEYIKTIVTLTGFCSKSLLWVVLTLLGSSVTLHEFWQLVQPGNMQQPGVHLIVLVLASCCIEHNESLIGDQVSLHRLKGKRLAEALITENATELLAKTDNLRNNLLLKLKVMS